MYKYKGRPNKRNYIKNFRHVCEKKNLMNIDDYGFSNLINNESEIDSKSSDKNRKSLSQMEQMNNFIISRDNNQKNSTQESSGASNNLNIKQSPIAEDVANSTP